MKEVKKKIKIMMEEENIPGLSICVINNKEQILSESYGYSNLCENKFVNNKTLFCIGSITKSFTATLFGILVDRKLLQWNDPIRNYISEFKFNNLTICDLLSHNTNIPNYDDMLFTNTFNSRKELINIVNKINIEEYDKKYSYNNFMYLVLGYLVEKLTGDLFEEFVRKNIFNILKMNASDFLNKKILIKKNLSNSYFETEDNVIKPIPQNFYLTTEKLLMNPAGGILSNIEDLYKWLLFNMYQSNYEKILTYERMYEIHHPQTIIYKKNYPKEFLFDFYAMGWRDQIYKGELIIRHAGHIGGYSAELGFLPKQKIGVAVLCNKEGSSIGQILSMYIYDLLLKKNLTNWNDRFKKQKNKKDELEKNILIKRYEERKKNNPSSFNFLDFNGEYKNEIYGCLLISNKNNLYITIKKDSYQLLHFHFNVFEFFDIFNHRYEIKFNTGFNGNVESLYLKFNLEKEPILFEKIKKTNNILVGG